MIEEDLCPFDMKDVVLDAGTGSGYLLDKLSFRCGRAYAIDINLDFLRKIERRVRKDKVELVQADVRKMPFKSEHFTRVVCTEVLEHLPNPSAAIEEFHRLLKPGGICVIAVPTFSSEKLYSILNRNYRQNEQSHVSILGRQQWISLFRQAGFDVFAVRNQNFQPAIYWTLRNIFPIKFDPSSGEIAGSRLTDKGFWYFMSAINKVTLGNFDRFGNKIFPKSWYFYLRRRLET